MFCLDLLATLVYTIMTVNLRLRRETCGLNWSQKNMGEKKIQKSKNTRRDKQIKGNDRVNVARLFCGLSTLEQCQGDL